MDLINNHLLKDSDKKRIEEMSSLAWPINNVLRFDMSGLTNPKGNTRVELVSGGYPTSSGIDIEYASADRDRIKKKKEDYERKMKSIVDQVGQFRNLAQNFFKQAEHAYSIGSKDIAREKNKEAEEQLVIANVLEHKAKSMESLTKDLQVILDDIDKCGSFRKTYSTEKLGKYVPQVDKVILYVNGPRDYDSKLLLITLVHELFHAFYHKHKVCSVVREIDEATVEFSMLSYLSFLKDNSQDTYYECLLNKAKKSVENKKYGMGELPAYGFGYYLYDHCNKPEDWVLAYNNKIGNISGTDPIANQYVKSLNPLYTDNEKKTYNTLSKILFGKANIGYVQNTTNTVGIEITKKIHSNVEITCVTLPNGGCVITKVDIKPGRNCTVDIPHSIKKVSKEYPITEIGSSSFPLIDRNITVRIPDSVTKIAPDAFGVGYVVIYTDKDGFEYYDRARTILKGYARKSQEIKIPANVISIGPSACTCKDNHVIEKVVIPSSVIHIWDNAFVGCDRIKNMDIPASLVFVGAGARIIKNEFEFADAKMTILKKYLGRDSRVSIPDTVSIIAPLAFDNRSSNLETVDVPSSITNISVNAFNGCSRLKNVKIPSTVNLIGDNTYYDFIKASNPKYTNSDFEFADAGETILWRYSGHSPVVTIPNTVTTIAPSAFEKCRELQSITIPSSVTQIWDKAFAGCDCLKNVTIPVSVGYIGKNAFEDVLDISYLGSGADGFPWGALQLVVDGDFAFKDSLKTCLSKYIGDSNVLVIPNSVTTIAKHAFKGRKNLTITIPNTVTTIERYAFSGCDQLSVCSSGNVFFSWQNIITGFEFKDANMTILKKYHGYRAPDSIPPSITQIEKNAFEGFTFKHPYNTIASGFPWGARYIVDDFEYSDAGRTQLKKYVGRSDTVVIPDSITHIEDGAFAANILERLINTKPTNWCITVAGNGNKHAQYQLGNRYYDAGDYQEAKMWFEKAASQGHKDALYCLGKIYYIGQGVEIDKESSTKYFIKAAESGCLDSKGYLHELAKESIPGAVEWCLMEKAKEQYSEAERYRRGDNRAFLLYLKSARAGYAEAINRLKELANNGNRKAKFELGEMYHNGIGVNRNEGEAMRWYGSAAKHGNAEAFNIIMQLAENGCNEAIEILKNLARKVPSVDQPLRILADQGNVIAQYVYGWLLESLNRNEDAKKYYFKAMLLGHSDAKEAYRRLKYNE